MNMQKEYDELQKLYCEDFLDALVFSYESESLPGDHPLVLIYNRLLALPTALDPSFEELESSIRERICSNFTSSALDFCSKNNLTDYNDLFVDGELFDQLIIYQSQEIVTYVKSMSYTFAPRKEYSILGAVHGLECLKKFCPVNLSTGEFNDVLRYNKSKNEFFIEYCSGVCLPLDRGEILPYASILLELLDRCPTLKADYSDYFSDYVPIYERELISLLQSLDLKSWTSLINSTNSSFF